MASAVSAREVQTGFSAAEASFEDAAVLVRVDEGIRRVRLQQWDDAAGRWRVIQLAHLSGEPGYIKFRLPAGATEDSIKVEVSRTDPFPYSYYLGRSSFGKTVEQPPPGPGAVTDGGDVRTFGPESEGGAQEVVESDIWKISGDRLWFFNQLRGLQVFDLAAPDQPAKLASLRMPAVGEQMYLLDDQHAILLVASRDWRQSEVVLAEMSGADELLESARIQLPGTIVESRLIGPRLYVVTRFVENVPIEGPDGTLDHEWMVRTGLDLSIIDFSNPANPVELPGMQLAEQDAWGFYNAQVAATPTHLLVSAFNSDRSPRSSDVYVIDITDPAEPPEIVAMVPVAGNITDKFKMRLEGGILTTVSQVSGFENNRWETAVETFQLDPTIEGGFSKLDSVTLGTGERLFATRFADDRLYIVTFEQIDPFWVIDISNPNELAILGELEVPGFSRYLEPIGDRVIAIGVEDRKVTASLFDAADPQNPALLSRVSMGEGFSWSEANYDEKAVGFDRDAGILLVPYQSWSDDKAEQAVQIIELQGDALIKHGAVAHDFTPRRAALRGDTIVSVSARELLVIDVSDLDNPVELSDTTIAWSVDTVIKVGDYLLQIEQGDPWTNAVDGLLRVTSVDDPDTVIRTLPIGEGTVVGVEQKNSLLYILSEQFESTSDVDTEGNNIVRTTRILRNSIVDISNPTLAEVLGMVERVEDLGENGFPWGSKMKAIWLPGGELAWVSADGGSSWWGIDWWYGVRPGLDVGLIWPGPYYWPGNREIHVLDVTDVATPEFVSSTAIKEENAWLYSEGFKLDDNSIAFSAQRLFETGNAGLYEQEYVMRVVDLSDPASPLVSDEISIPGTLISVAQGESGPVLITETQESAVETMPDKLQGTDGFIQASVFDGISAFLVDEATIEGGAWAASAAVDGVVFHEIYISGEDYHLVGHVWDSGLSRFVETPRIALEGYQSDLAIRDDLLLGWRYPSNLTAWDITDPLTPGAAETFDVGGSVWVQLDHAWVDRNSGAWIPAGIYGVEHVDFAGAFSTPAAVLPRISFLAAGEPEWIEVPAEELQWVEAAAADEVGGLGDSAWRFVSTVEPEARSIQAGSALTLSVDVAEASGVEVQWQFNGMDIPGATGPTYTIPVAQRSHAGEYRVVFVQGAGGVTMSVAVSVAAPPPAGGRVLNMSTRGMSLGGEGSLIPGFVIKGQGSKRLLIRAVGPTLGADPFNLPEVLPDPRLVLRRWNPALSPNGGYELVAANDDWTANPDADEVLATSVELQAFDLVDSREAALLVDLPAGQYTLAADGEDGGTGLALAEIYDADDPDAQAELVNISNRGFVGRGDEVMIPGFVVSGDGPQTFLIRAVGPGLAPYGVTQFLKNPRLAVYRSDDFEPLLTNDDWGEDPDAAYTAEVAEQVAAFALEPGSRDAALVATLPPGAYTVIGSGADEGDVGVALVEIYVVP